MQDEGQGDPLSVDHTIQETHLEINQVIPLFLVRYTKP